MMSLLSSLKSSTSTILFNAYVRAIRGRSTRSKVRLRMRWPCASQIPDDFFLIIAYADRVETKMYILQSNLELSLTSITWKGFPCHHPFFSTYFVRRHPSMPAVFGRLCGAPSVCFRTFAMELTCDSSTIIREWVAAEIKPKTMQRAE